MSPRKNASRPVLQDVCVPHKFKAVFLKAQELVRSYFGHRYEDAARGKIEISGKRYLMVRAASMSVDFFGVVKEMYDEMGEKEAINIARSILFDVAHGIGKADAREFYKKMKLKGPLAKLSAGPIHFAHTGWAFVDIAGKSRPVPNNNYYLLYDHPFSFESDSWIGAGKRSPFPVCIMNAGYSSGWCEESFNIELVATEVMCKARGDRVCRFIMAPPDRIEGHVQRFLKRHPKLARRTAREKIPLCFERQYAAKTMRASEERYHRLFEDSNDAVFLHLGDGRILDVNTRACEMLGYDKNALLKKRIPQLHPISCRSDSKRALAEVVKKGVVRFESHFKRANGSIVDVEISARKVEMPERLIQGIVRDITERKRAERTLKEAHEKLEVRVQERTLDLERINHELKREVAARRHIEEDLRRSRQLYQTLAETAEDYIFTIGPDLKVQYVNNYGVRALGGGHSSIVGRHVGELFSQETSTRFIKGLKRVFETGEPLMEVDETDFAGRKIWLHTKLVPIKANRGDVAAVLGLSRDITESRRAEDALRRERDRAQNYLDIADVMLVALDAGGRVTLINKKGATILGRDEKDIVGRTWFDSFIPESARKSTRKVFDAIMRGETQLFGYYKNVVVNSAGEERMISWFNTTLTDDAGHIIGTLSSGQDITDRQRAEESLRESERRYRQLFEDSPVSLWEEDYSEVMKYVDELRSQGVTDFAVYCAKHEDAVRRCVAKVHIVDVNRATLALYGASCKEELVAGLDRIFAPESYDVFKQGILSIIAGKDHFESEAVNLKLDGTPMNITISWTIAPGYEKTRSKVLVSIMDITERKHLENAVRQALKVKSDFIATMSHELRTPLNSIIGSADLVLNDSSLNLPERRQKNLKSVLAGADVLLTIINNILEMARIEAGSVPLYIERVNAADVVRAGIETCRGLILHKPIAFIEHFEENLPDVETDRDKLRHIVVNLISNAIKFTEKGRIDVAVYREADKPGDIVVRVSDTGVGIPLGKMSVIFEQFRQGDVSMTRRYGGIGLGLAIVKSYAELLGMTVDVESEEGKGSVFTVRIPLRCDRL